MDNILQAIINSALSYNKVCANYKRTNVFVLSDKKEILQCKFCEKDIHTE